MITLLFVVSLFHVISAEGNSETRFIETLPEADKKEFLDRVAGRILREVPEVESDASARTNGDVLDEKLEKQSDFVKRILKEEVENLKLKRRHNLEVVNATKVFNGTDLLNQLNVSDKREDTTVADVMEKVDLRSGVNETAAEDKSSTHIDLTLRTDRDKRNDDSIKNHQNTVIGTLPDDKKEKSYETQIPVEVKFDGEGSKVKHTNVVEAKQPRRFETEEHDSKSSSKDDSKSSSETDNNEKLDSDASSAQADVSKTYYKRSKTRKTDNVVNPNSAEENKNDASNSTTEKVYSIKPTTYSDDTADQTSKVSNEVTDHQEFSEAFTTTTDAVETVSINVTGEVYKDNETPPTNKLNFTLRESEQNYTTTEKQVTSHKHKLRMRVEDKTNETNGASERESVKIIKNDSSSDFLENNSSIENKTERVTNIEKLDQNMTQQSEYYSTTTVVTLTTTEEPYKSTSGLSYAATTQKVDKVTTNNNHSMVIENKPDDINEKEIQDSNEISPERPTASDVNTIATAASITTPKFVERTDIDSERVGAHKMDSNILNAADNHIGINTINKADATNPIMIRVKVTDNKVDNKTNATVNDSEKKKSNLRIGSEELDELSDILTQFGNPETEKVYHVYEVDPRKPIFTEKHKKKIDIEQPKYAPVYNYDSKHAYFNAYNRLGPNVEENLSEELKNNLRVFDTRDDIDLDYYFDRNLQPNVHSKRIFKVPEKKKKKKILYSKQGVVDDDNDSESYIHNNPENNNEPSEIELEKSTEKNCKHDSNIHIPDSSEEDHAHHSQNHGLKDSLKEIRQVYYQNKMFGYVPTEKERIAKLNETVRDLYGNALENSTEEILSQAGYKPDLRAKDDLGGYVYDDATEDEEDVEKHDFKSNEIEVVTDEPKNMNKGIALLLFLRAGDGSYQDPSFDWNREKETLTHNGTTYDLKRLIPPYATTSGGQRVHQLDEVRNVLYKINYYANPNNTVHDNTDFPPNVYKQVKHYIFAMNQESHILNNTDMINIIHSVDEIEKNSKHKKKSLRQSQSKGQNNKYLDKLRIGRPHKMSLREQVVNVNETATNAAGINTKITPDFGGKVDTMQKITIITPAVDMIANAIKMWETTLIPVKAAIRTSTEETNIFLNILKDLINMDNSALETFDWLGSTVDIQGALEKLKLLIEYQKRGHYIHPSDLQLLNYIKEVYRRAKRLEVEDDTKEPETGKARMEYDRARFPKTHKKIKKPLKVLEKIWALMRNSKLEEFEEFLDELQNYLYDFHSAIKKLASVTTYNNQNWYKNIKKLYLKSGGDKEYSEVLLHLIANRLFGLIEESSKNGAEEDYKKYIEENRAAVERTEAEFLFLFRTLSQIKKLRG